MRPQVSIFLLFTPFLVLAETPAPRGETQRIEPAITGPQLLRLVQPPYSEEARLGGVQGTLVCQVLIDEKGRPIDISILSPLGFGLDEQAQVAIQSWEYAPATKNGKPVKSLSTVEVTYRLENERFDEKSERQRTEYNRALSALGQPGASAEDIDRAVKAVRGLAARKFPAAMYAAGLWAIEGEYGPRNEAEGLALVRKSAEKNYGPALYEVARRMIETHDVGEGLDEMRRAAILGSAPAQFHLGNRYEHGDGVPRETDRAKRYFRLCATQGLAPCQYRLGRLLLDPPYRPEREYVQAVALMELAAEQGLSAAKEIASAEARKLTLEQAAWVKTLKGQLVRK